MHKNKYSVLTYTFFIAMNSSNISKKNQFNWKEYIKIFDQLIDLKIIVYISHLNFSVIEFTEGMNILLVCEFTFLLLYKYMRLNIL